MNREAYIEKVLNAVSIKIGNAIESNNENMWDLIDDYIKSGIEEAYNKGHDDGYSEGYGDAMNTASYEFDRERGYL